MLTHAIIDALLGAAGEGDIGAHFPDTDERYRDADSLELLRVVVALVTRRDLVIRHVDATVVMERPRLAPHRDAIRDRLAAELGVGPGGVNVKATAERGWASSAAARASRRWRSPRSRTRARAHRPRELGRSRPLPARGGRVAQLLVLDLALELLKRAAQVAADGGRGQPLGQHPPEARSGDSIREPELHLGSPRRGRACASARAGRRR